MKTQLDQYARFIDSTPSYVITEALKVLSKRDDEFKAWLGQQIGNGSSPKPDTGLRKEIGNTEIAQESVWKENKE